MLWYNRRTNCWTEAPDGPFRYGSRVGGGSVNMVVIAKGNAMKTLNETDQRGSAMFGIVVCMGALFITTSTEKHSFVYFCIACTAMLSMMQLASVSNPSFRQRYRYMSYLFVFAPVVSSIIYLVRERARILDDYGSFLYGLIPAIIFFVCYTWYIKVHGVASCSDKPEALTETEEAITKNCSEGLDRPL